MTDKILSQAHMEWLTVDRAIGEETIAQFGIYTGRYQTNAEQRLSRHQMAHVLNDTVGNLIVFPFEERGRIVNEKYRLHPDKDFRQLLGGRKTFFNADVLDDPALIEGRYPLIITEGELDALSAIDCGFPFTVSVPDGAPPVPKGKSPEDLEPLDPNAEGSGKFEFLWNNRERLKSIKRFVIAVDNDDPGKRLAAELVRRLSASKCLFVEYPIGKDLNDVLMRRGPEAVTTVLNAAKPYPVRGLYRLADYPELPPVPTFSLGWSTMDEVCKIFPGEFMVMTGVPNHGKSAFVLNIVVNLAERYGWQTALFSPEMNTVPQIRDRLRKMVLRRSPMPMELEAIAKADAWINRQIVFIDADPTGRDDENFDLDWILDRATDAVLRDGVNMLVIDPWNEVEHARKQGESMGDYIGRSIRALKRFAKLYNVAVIVVAHPTKDIVGKDGKPRTISLYDIADSAHWFNKCDHGLIVDRPDPFKDEALVRVAKVRFEESGEKGAIRLRYDRSTARFEMLEPDREELP